MQYLGKMHNMSLHIKCFFTLLRCWPLFLYYQICKIINHKGVDLWVQDMQRMGETSICRLFTIRPYYKVLFYHRLSIPLTIAKFLFGSYPIALSTKHIGGGLRMEHPYGSILYAKAIGDNLWVMHNVTIGQNHEKLPIIGNNVFCGVGACVLGDISVGDNVNIGANTVIVKDVPSDCTVIGNPAIIVKQNGRKVNSPL